MNSLRCGKSQAPEVPSKLARAVQVPTVAAAKWLAEAERSQSMIPREKDGLLVAHSCAKSQVKGPLVVNVATMMTIAALCLAAGPAQAQVQCTDLPNPVIGQGGSAHVPFLSKVGPLLAQLSPPISLIYQAPGACIGVTSLINKTALTGTATYWTQQGEQTCELPLQGVQPQFAAMGVFASSCEGVGGLPSTIGDFQTSLNTWNIITSAASTQASISSEALYFVYGFGDQGQVSPWTDPSQIFSRNATSAAGIFVATAAGIPPTRLFGLDVKTNQAMVTSVGSSPNPNAAIGFVSGEVADQNRATVKTLAYQHKGQRCAYWPDSSLTAFDKLPTRQGQYYLWSTTHFFAPIDGSGRPTDPLVRQVIDWFTGAVEPPPQLPVLEIEIDNGNIPKCAMQVWRDEDLGPLYSFEPESPCGCYFEFKATGQSNCRQCATDTNCEADAPVCRFGYCEVK